MPDPGAKSRMIRRFQIGSATLLLLFLPACHVHRLPTPIAHITRARLPSFKHVFVVVEENQGYADVIGNTQDMPYLNSLAARYGLATNYYADARRRKRHCTIPPCCATSRGLIWGRSRCRMRPRS